VRVHIERKRFRRGPEKFGRNADLSKIGETFKMLSTAKIATCAYFMVGFPGETHDRIYETVRFARSLELDFAQFLLLTPAPGTIFYKRLISEGKIEDIWGQQVLTPTKNHFIPFYQTTIHERSSKNFTEGVLFKFYLRSSMVLRRGDPVGSLIAK
jgi:radical SAM superfamily enzyme YgiQ (UPF0313 family)